MSRPTIDMSARYAVDGWRGVAFRVDGLPQIWEPYTYVVDTDEGEMEIECLYGEGEWVDDTASGQIVVVMVGDDRKWTVDISDLTVLDDNDYCRECGQIGCAHGAIS